MSKSLRFLARFIVIVGWLIGAGMVFVGLYDGSDVGGLLIGVLLFPVFVATLPILYIFNDGEWLLFLLIYGSPVAFYVIDNIADKMDAPCP